MFAEIVLPVPLDKAFHYRIPDSVSGKVVPGVRVRVPFGRSVRVGYCVGLVEATDVKELKEIGSVVDSAPVLDASLLQLTRWMADYYICSWGQVLEAALPGPVRRESARRTTVAGIELAISPEEARARLEDKDRDTMGQKMVLRSVLESAGRAQKFALRELARELKITESPIRSLVKKGVLRGVQLVIDRDPFRDITVAHEEPPVATPDQRRALDLIFGLKHPCFEDSSCGKASMVQDSRAEIPSPLMGGGQGGGDSAGKYSTAASLGTATPHPSPPPQGGRETREHAPSEVLPSFEPCTVLVHGVTSSGKTEIYLRVIQKVVKAGKQAIVLVPEVSLTPQMITRFKARFERVAVLHYQMTDAQRHHEWTRIHEGLADVVIGARSAIFAPVQRLGLIVVDEEHEPSYKQDSTPRYHGRDVAVVRGRIAGALVLLGSATPSLESHHNCLTGKYHRVSLPSRIGGRPLPPVEVIDMTKELKGKGPFRTISQQLEISVKRALARDEKVILFLNRRGFYTFVVCGRCGFVARCRRCEIALTYHKQYGKGLCHYCGEQQPLPARCPECQFQGMRLLGTGTEKVYEEAAQLFGDNAIARVDSDSMRGRQAYRKVFATFLEGEVDMLVGTQVIGKGLDIPDVTLVGVVSGDTCLHLRDFRSAERTMQLIMQVAGRSGRGPKGGSVIVQTFNPGHYAIQAAVMHDYDLFARQELELRRQLGYPPFGRLIRIVVQGKKAPAVCSRAAELATRMKAYIAKNRAIPGTSGTAAGVDVLGPAPAPIERIKDRWRWHLLLRSRDSGLLHDAVRSAGHLLARKEGVSVQVDVDPLDML